MMNTLIISVASLIVAAVFSSCAADVMIIAHRGASRDAPENTLASVELAWVCDADAVEIDVHLSRDGRIVAIHDSDTKRTAGKEGKVADQALDELKRLDAGAWKGDQWAGERIPTLEEVLDTVPSGKKLFVEIKCGPEVLPRLKKVIGAARCSEDQVVIIGFDLETVTRAKQSLPSHRVYWLSSMKKDEKENRWKPTVKEMLGRVRGTGIDGLNVKACEAVNRAFVEEVNAAGLGVFVWTVNDPTEAARLEAVGVEGITTDCPRMLREKMQGAKGTGE